MAKAKKDELAEPRSWDLVVATITDIAGKRGDVSPAIIVEEARSPASPLHAHFLWNPGEVHERYLLGQAAVLLRRVQIHIVRQDQATKRLEVKPVRALQSVPDKRKKGGASYSLASSIAQNPDEHASLVRGALAELNAVRKRYAEIAELADVWAAVAAVTI